MNVGNRIKSMRLRRGLSAERLAEIIGVSPATIYRYENGGIENMRTDKIVPIADALGCTSSYLMGWEDDPVSDPDAEIWDLREQLRRNPELRTLFSLSKNATVDDLRKTVAFLKIIKGDDPNA